MQIVLHIEEDKEFIYPQANQVSILRISLRRPGSYVSSKEPGHTAKSF